MKLAVASVLPSVNARVGLTVKSSPYISMFDTETKLHKSVPDPMFRADPKSALRTLVEQLSSWSVSALIARQCSRSTEEVLSFGGIRVVAGVDGSVMDGLLQESA